ncbi:hypothetical protein CWO91_33010 [Bradyrhizobium genosp. SA-3]|nr:hypothetical protein CWO91_33010 [Bradyrhizobium genosp. SA-3]
MRRNRRKQTTSLEERLADHARLTRKRAMELPPGEQREALLRKSVRAETAVRISNWLVSPKSRQSS